MQIVAFSWIYWILRCDHSCGCDIYMHWRIIVLQFPTSIFVSAAQSKICAKEDTVQPFTIDDFVALHRWCLFTLRICFVRSCKIWNKCDEHVIAIWVYIYEYARFREYSPSRTRESVWNILCNEIMWNREGFPCSFLCTTRYFGKGNWKYNFILRVYIKPDRNSTKNINAVECLIIQRSGSTCLPRQLNYSCAGEIRNYPRLRTPVA